MQKHIIVNIIILLFTLQSLLFSFESRIIGGEKTDGNLFKKINFVVAIGNKYAIEGKKIFLPYCTGTLLSEKWVLTAAHCLMEEDIFIYAKSNDLFNEDETDNAKTSLIVKVSQIFYPDDFKMEKLEERLIYINDDIAFLELEKPILLDNYPSLASNAIINEVINTKKEATMAGWGNIELGKDSDTLYIAKLKVINNKACKYAYENYDAEDYPLDASKKSKYIDAVIDFVTTDKFSEDILCAGGYAVEDKAIGACPGDSGGPLLYEKNKNYYVLGTNSTGPRDCGRLPSKLMNMGVYKDFIQETMKNKNNPVVKDILRKGFINDLPSGFHMLGTEVLIDNKSDIFENVKFVYYQNNDILEKLEIKNGKLPEGVVIEPKSGFWIQK